MFNQTLEDIANHYQVSRRMIQRWVDTGRLKYGVEYIDLRLPDGHRARLRFNLQAMNNFFMAPPEKR
jgi:predicted site-specific integrase-resolvase